MEPEAENMKTLRQEQNVLANVPAFFLDAKTIYKIRIMSEKVYNKHIIIIVT